MLGEGLDGTDVGKAACATATEHLPPAQPEARIALSEALDDREALVRAYAVLALTSG